MSLKEQLLNKLFHDQCTPEELEQLFQLLQDDPEETGPDVMLKLLEQMEPSSTTSTENTKRIQALVLDQIGVSEQEEDNVKPLRGAKLNRRNWIIRIAASMLILMLSSWGIFELWGNRQITKETAYGEIREFTLPDGSKTILNGNSTLTYPANWAEAETRVVHLEGEAFFQVKKIPSTQAKFHVITNDLTVEVLGTAFNVNTHKSETSVFLEEGNVKVHLEHNKDQEIQIKPGEMMLYSAKRKKLTPPQLAENFSQTSWKKGMLSFKDTTLLEILEKLAEAHQLKYEFANDSLKQTEITTMLPTKDMDKAMSILSKTSQITISKENGIFFIRPIQ